MPRIPESVRLDEGTLPFVWAPRLHVNPLICHSVMPILCHTGRGYAPVERMPLHRAALADTGNGYVLALIPHRRLRLLDEPMAMSPPVHPIDNRRPRHACGHDQHGDSGYNCPYPSKEAAEAARVKFAKFPVGAWVKDRFMQRISGGIEPRGSFGGYQFRPFAGEIISIGTMNDLTCYRIKFGEYESIAFERDCVCYQCGAPADDLHSEMCPDPKLRLMPHEPGYCA